MIALVYLEISEKSGRFPPAKFCARLLTKFGNPEYELRLKIPPRSFTFARTTPLFWKNETIAGK